MAFFHGSQELPLRVLLQLVCDQARVLRISNNEN